MAFTRTKSTWFKGDALTAAQINTIDTNISNALDVRALQHNDIRSYGNVSDSDIIINTGSKQTWNAGGFNLQYNGTLEVDSLFTGANLPLKFGWIEDTVSTASHTLTTNAQIARNVKLSGTRSANTTVILPQVEGAEKVIVNHIQPASSSQNLYLTLHTNYTLAQGLPGIILPIVRNNTTGGKAIHIVCDGYRWYEINRVPINYVNQMEYWIPSASVFPYNASSTSYVSITSLAFTNLVVGDWLEISYNATLTNSNASGTTWISAYLDMSGTPIQIKPSERFWQGTSKMTFSWKGLHQVSAASHTVHLAIKYGAYVGTVISPTLLYVKVIKG